MPGKGWSTISLPVPLVEEIRGAASSSGYRSIAEFVRDACRRRLEEIERTDTSSRGASRTGAEEVSEAEKAEV